MNFPPQTLPRWDSVYKYYPKKPDGTEMCGSEVYELIGGDVLANKPPSENACALRVSLALNYSGITIPNIVGQTYKGEDNKNYFFSSAKLFNFLKKTFTIPPNPTNSIDSLSKSQGGIDGVNFPTLLNGKKGIYLMQSSYPRKFGALGHASLWNNNTCMQHDCGDGLTNGCYFNGAGGVEKIFLWKLN
jgi:Type VI secretion system (T6SS), amidase effector protein 4